MTLPAPAYLVDNLVDSVRNKFTLPNSDNLLTDQNLVDLLDEEMRSILIPLIVSCHAEFFVTNYDQTISASTHAYDLPQRAVGGVLRDVLLVDSSSNEFPMSYVDPSMVKYGNYSTSNYQFTVRNDQIILLPESQNAPTGYTLRMRYERRPSNLTLSSNCGQILTIADTDITLSAVSTDWETTTTFDIIQNHPQFRSISDDQAITAITANVLTLDEAPTGLSVGQWVCPTLTTCIPQIPYEAFPHLVQRGIIRAADSVGDKAALENAKGTWVEMSVKLTALLTPRVKGTPRVVRNPNIGASNYGFRGCGL